MKKKLRYYQQEAIQTVGHELINNGVNSQLLVLPTGSGKTLTASKIVSKDRFERVLWLTHNIELIEQSALALAYELFCEDDEMIDYIKNTIEKEGVWSYLNTYHKFDDLESDFLPNRFKSMIGIIKQKRMDLNSRVVVASVQTIHRRLDKISPNHFDLVVVDEAHLFIAKSYLKAVRHFNPGLLLGLSATPHRADGFSLGNLFDKISYEYPVHKAIDDGYLCDMEAIQVQTELNIDEVRTTAGELNQKDLRIIDIPERNFLIADKYKEYAEGRQAIVFCIDVKHAMRVSAAFNSRGIKASFVVGDEEVCPDRKERIEAFKRGEIQVLTNCLILTTGFDHPNTSCAIMACPTKSKTKFLQSVGRVMRLKDEVHVKKFGQNAIVLDIVDTTSKHNLVNTWSLDEGKNIEDRMFMPKSRKQDLIEEREKKKLQSQRKKDQKINLLPIPEVKISSSKKMKEPATEKQLDWLKRLGYDIENNEYTKGMASEFIGGQKATQKQVNALKKWRYYIPEEGITIAQAQAAFKEIGEKHGKPKKQVQYEQKAKAEKLPFGLGK